MFAQSMEDLKRVVVGGLGATLFGAACLLAAAGPAATVKASLPTLSQPAQSPQS